MLLITVLFTECVMMLQDLIQYPVPEYDQLIMLERGPESDLTQMIGNTE